MADGISWERIPSTAELAAARRRAPAAAQVVPLGEDAAAIVFDQAGGAEPPKRRRLEARLDGAAPPRPVVTTALELRAGGRRHVLLLPQRASVVAKRRIELTLDGDPVAGVDPDWLRDPLADGYALVGGLAEAGRARLLRCLFGTAASALRVSGGAEIASGALALASLLGLDGPPPSSWTRLPSGRTILSWTLPACGLDPALPAFAAVDGRRTRVISPSAAFVERRERGASLHLALDTPPPSDGLLLPLGGGAPTLRAQAASLRPAPFAYWLRRRSTAARAWALALLEALALRDPEAAALAAELAAAPDEAPRLTLTHLSATPGGLLVCGSLRDPLGLVTAIQIERGASVQRLPAPDRGGPVAAFAPLPRPSIFSDACKLRLVTRSGNRLTAHAGAPPAFRGAAPENWRNDAALFRQSAAALAEARETMPPRRLAWRRVALQAAETPALSLVCALGRGSDTLRALQAMVFVEPEASRVELVTCMSEAEAERGALAALGDLAAVYRLPSVAVVIRGDPTLPERLRAGLAGRTAPTALWLGPGVLPARGGWLRRTLSTGRLGRRPRLVGGLALGFDGSIRDAGAIAPDLVGLPWREAPPDGLAPAAVPATGCFGLDPAAAVIAGAIEAPYGTLGGFVAELSDRVRAAGGLCRTDFSRRFVAYDPTPRDPLEEAADAALLSRRCGGSRSAMKG